jgi:hypothetical protein
MEAFSPLPDELTPASDTSNTVKFINELCLKLSVNVVRVRVFLKEKPNDHSLVGRHPKVKNLNIEELSIFEERCSLDGGPGCLAMVLGRSTLLTS